MWYKALCKNKCEKCGYKWSDPIPYCPDCGTENEIYDINKELNKLKQAILDSWAGKKVEKFLGWIINRIS